MVKWFSCVYARLGKWSLIQQTSSRKGVWVINRRQWLDINSFYVFLYELQFQSALIILIGILFIIQDYLCFIYCYGYSWFKQWVQDVGSFLLKVLLCYLHTCRSSVTRIRIKQALGALSSKPTPPGVDCGSTLSNMFVFDFALLDSKKLGWKV